MLAPIIPKETMYHGDRFSPRKNAASELLFFPFPVSQGNQKQYCKIADNSDQYPHNGRKGTIYFAIYFLSVNQ